MDNTDDERTAKEELLALIDVEACASRQRARCLMTELAELMVDAEKRRIINVATAVQKSAVTLDKIVQNLRRAWDL